MYILLNYWRRKNKYNIDNKEIIGIKKGVK